MMPKSLGQKQIVLTLYRQEENSGVGGIWRITLRDFLGEQLFQKPFLMAKSAFLTTTTMACLLMLAAACGDQKPSAEADMWEKLPVLSLPFDTKAEAKEALVLDTATVRAWGLADAAQSFEPTETWSAIGTVKMGDKLTGLIYSYNSTSDEHLYLALYNPSRRLVQRHPLAIVGPSRGGILPVSSLIRNDGMIESQIESLDTQGTLSYTIVPDGSIREAGRNLSARSLPSESPQTYAYYGKVGGAEAWFFLTLAPDKSLSGYYYNCLQNGKRSQNYGLRGKLSDAHSLSLEEYTQGELSATIVLQSEHKNAQMQQWKGQMRNTDGTTYPVAMAIDPFALPDLGELDGQGLQPKPALKADALQRLQNSINQDVYFDVSKDRQYIIAQADSPCGWVAYSRTHEWLATSECTQEAERVQLQQAQQKLGYFTPEAITAGAMLKCATPTKTWYSLYSSKVSNPQEQYLLIFDTDFKLQRATKLCD